MDKKSNRTDLLAAGRKKLQQFRQKKDNKGKDGRGKDSKGSGKSANKADTSEERNDDVVVTPAVVEEEARSSPEQQIEVHDESGSSLSVPVENLVDSASDTKEHDQLSMPVTTDIDRDTVSGNTVVPDLDAGMVLTSMNYNFGPSPSEEGKHKLDNLQAERFATSETTESEIVHADGSLPIAGLAPGVQVTAVSTEAKGLHKGDQVRHVGAMQEAENFGSKRNDGDVEPALEGNASVSVCNRRGEIPSVDNIEVAKCELEHSGNVDVSAIVSDAIDRDGYADESSRLAVVAPVPTPIIPEGPQELQQQVVEAVYGSFKESPSLLRPMSPDSGSYAKEGEQGDWKSMALYKEYRESDMPQVRSHGKPMETEMVDIVGGHSVITGVDWSSFSLVKLAQLLKGLPDDEFRYLVKSRETVDYGSHTITNHAAANSSETLQQQLYLGNITKDFFELQLLEQAKQQTDIDLLHHSSIDELAMRTASLADSQENNKFLALELAHCRSELDSSLSEREELQNQCQSLKEELSKFSDRADALKIKLEESDEHFSGLSTELDNCKGLLAASHEENERLLKSLAAVSEQRNRSEEAMEQYVRENQKLSMELSDQKVQLDGLQEEIANWNANVASITGERKKLEDEKWQLLNDKDRLLLDLADRKALLDALREENSRLSSSLSSEVEERKKLEVDKEFLLQEIERLSAEIIVYQQKLSTEHEENVQLENDLNDAISRLEQLTEENIFLNSSVEVHKAKITEIGSRHFQIPSLAVDSGNEKFSGCGSTADGEKSQAAAVQQDVDGAFHTAVTPVCDDSAGEPAASWLQSKCSNDSSGFAGLKRHLEEVEGIVEKLEKALERMHSHSTSLMHSAGKAAAPGVSKLIQAFESKVHVDEHEPEGAVSTEILGPVDPYLVAKEQTGNLRAVLEAMCQDAESADGLLRIEKDRSRAAKVALEELELQNEALKNCSLSLEVRNLELEVLCEAIKQHACSMESWTSHLQNSLEDLRRQDTSLQNEKIDLGKKLTDYNSRISELQDQLYGIRRSSDEVAPSIHEQMEMLQNEMTENVSVVERNLNADLADVAWMLGKLDAAVGQPFSSPADTDHKLDIFGHVSFSVNAACEMINVLKLRLESACKDYEVLSISHTDVNRKLGALSEQNELAVGLLQKISSELVHLLKDSSDHMKGTEIERGDDTSPGPLDVSQYEAVVKQLGSLLGERLLLKDSHDKLHSELLCRTIDIEELTKRYIHPEAIQKLVLDAKNMMKLECPEFNLDESPLSNLQTFILLLIQKYKEADAQGTVFRENASSRMSELSELQDHIEHLYALNFCQKNEILIFRETLVQAKNACDSVQAKLLEKVHEVEQAEQRVASVREKLSIAVAKGKGLVVQRDSLKQSLAETSSELEKCSEELQLKDARLQEVEEKLKAYSEAGERMEALESELSYIRNSATALRESFLLKDSALQRIEEILEDLELPEHFHTKSIIEKVDWLAKSATGNSLPPADWDQRSSVEGASYSDAGFAVMDGWKEDTQPNSNPVDELRRKYDELQTRFYELAEQNEMLEQSLMERNNLVQRWEEILDRIDTPPQLRMMDPEERIHCLGSAMSEADHHIRSLQEKIDGLENYCGSLSADLEESQRRIFELESSLQATFQEKENALSEMAQHKSSLEQKIDILERNCELLSADGEESQRRMSELKSSLQTAVQEKENLSGELVALTSDHESALNRVAEVESETNGLRNKVESLQEQLKEHVGNEERVRQFEGVIKRLQDLVVDALNHSGSENVFCADANIQNLESLLQRLLENYSRFSTLSPRPGETLVECTYDNAANSDEVGTRATDIDASATLDEAKATGVGSEAQLNIADLRRELDEALAESITLREERDGYMLKNQTLLNEVEALSSKREELQELLNQEEQKAASLREKLNIAVRKGKQLVQHRDSLKETIQEMTAEIDHLKSEIELRENAISEFDQKIKDMSAQLEEGKVFQAENLILKNRLVGIEQNLQDRALSMVFSKLGEVGIEFEINVSDPLQKLEQIGKLWSDLHAAMDSSEQEAKKSKRAAELLLAELNEVQERNDGLQEELARVHEEISDLSREKDAAESAKVEALSKLGKFSDERAEQLQEFEELKSSILELEKAFYDISNVTMSVFTVDMKLLHKVRDGMQSCLKVIESDLLNNTVSECQILSNFRNKDFEPANVPWNTKMRDMDEGVGFDTCHLIVARMHQLTAAFSDFKRRINGHAISLEEQAEVLTNLISRVQREVASQRESIESIKAELIRLESSEKEKEMESIVMNRSISLLYEACTSSIMEIENRKAQLVGNVGDVRDPRVSLDDAGILFGSKSISSLEESIKTLADRLLVAVKDVLSIQAESMQRHHKEMRTTILNLQKELQEKDIQRDQICKELVSQIKEAEAAVANYSGDLHSAKNQVHDLERQLEMMGEEKRLLELRLAEWQQEQTNSKELEVKLKSLIETVAAKEQEIEALMQALDEEENQMEGLRHKIEKLEREVQQKNLQLECVEASRAKAVKKLAVTVNKFDELHHMSEGLLSEVENLQSQLRDRDAEISFLRQEVTRCTNDAIEASKIARERDSDGLDELLRWLDTMFSRVLMRDAPGGIDNSKHDHEYKERLQKDITSILSELEDLRVAAQSRDALLQEERNRVAELLLSKDALEASLHEKQQHLGSLQGISESVQPTSEIVEVEPVISKWTKPVSSTASQVRSLRKSNTDQVSIAIDTDAGSSGRLEDEDDDKVHGFKSLATSKFMPKFTRPLSDMIDGLWVSCDRALMRQPAFRLGILLYWAMLHALLATFVV